jgi:peptidyl-prolyl cis-trans isomerase D
LRVTEIKPQVVKSLAEASADIRKELALADASRVLTEVHDSYEDARAAGETMKEAADRLKLKVVTIDAISRSAQAPDGSVINTLPQSRDLLQAAFEAETGVENPPVNMGSNGYVFYEVDGVIPARDRTLDEVREKVVADWTKAETATRLAAKGEELRKRVKDGTSLDVLAGELSLEKQTKRGLKRATDDADFGEAGIASVFGIGEGDEGVVSAPAGDAQILFKVAESFEPAGAGPDSVPEDARQQFAAAMSSDLLDQLVGQLQAQYKVTIDRNALNQALAF